ncbi:MAG: hypothetical protein IJ520_08540, partial [Synergistaceae bacterium]|nr:hypothetical protein [Synergistaceae bacterium]
MSLFRGLIRLINLLIIAAVLLVGAAAGLIWLPTGETVVKPALKYASENYLQPLRIDVNEIDGSVYRGYALKDLKIFSGDELYVSLDYAALSPDWDALLSNKPLIKIINLFELDGLSADAANLMNIANHFMSASDDNSESDFNLELQPVNIDIKHVNINNILAVIDKADKLDFNLNNFALSASGDVDLKSNLVLNNKNFLPVNLNAKVNYLNNIFEIASSKFNIGRGTGAVKGSVQPLALRTDFTAFKLEDFMPFAKIFIDDIDASGRLDGRVFIDEELRTNGVISLQQAKIVRNKLSVPLSFRVPFDWDGDILKFKDLNLKTKAAELRLDAELDDENIKLRGKAENISLSEIGNIAAPDLKLRGTGGQLDFDILLKDTEQGFDLNKIAVKLNANIPEFAALNKNLAKNFTAKINLRPGYKPEVECGGEIFGGKLSAQGEVYQDNNNNIKPELIINLANLDLAALSAALPELNAFKPSGRVNLNTRVHSDLNIDGSLSSAKVAAKISGNNLALNNLSANFNYDVNNNKALIKAFKANFNNALLSAAGAVDIKNNNLDLKASARNFNPASLPQVKNQLKGLFNADAVIKGALDNPSVNAKVSGKNVIADNNIKLGDLNLALNYFDKKLNVAQSQVRMPGGALNFKGNVNLNNNLINFDLSSGQNGINLAQVSQNLKLAQPVTGNIKGAASVTGSLKNLGAKLILNAENIKTQGVNIPYAVIEAGGNAGQIKVKKLDAKINEARITGRGGVKINYNNFLESALNI